MKNILATALAFSVSLMALAEPVSKQAALYTAKSFLLSRGKNPLQTPHPPLGGVPAAKKLPLKGDGGSVGEAFYVFNVGENNGFVIVSADDRTEPILGFVEHGTFDSESIPENMKAWLLSCEEQIRYIIDNDVKPDSPLLRRRSKVQSVRHSVPEILSTRWDQGLPYNIACPKYYKSDGSQANPATGCTATAMAQVINFYKFPEKIAADIPALTNTYTLSDGTKMTSTAPIVPAGTSIDWENMRDSYVWESGHVANAQDYAVANLMLYCGQSVRMGYGASSGGNFNAEAFIKYFGFDDSAFVGFRSDYSLDRWTDMLYHEIEEGYPVIMAGNSSRSGHAFVIDGFDGDNLFHVNWGWSGSCNGYFLIGILNSGDTSGSLATSSSAGYSMGQCALFNLRLPDDVKADSQTRLTADDISITSSSIRCKWSNKTGSQGTFSTGIVMLTEDGSISLVGQPQTISGMAAGATSQKTYQLLRKLPQGTYRLSPASKQNVSRTWRPAYNLYYDYIEAVVDSVGKPTLTIVHSENILDIDTIVFPGSRAAGEQQEVKVTFRNNGNDYYHEVFLFTRKDGGELTYSGYRAPISLRRGETTEVSYYFKPAEAGTYELMFFSDYSHNSLVAQGTAEIIEAAQADKAFLRVTSYSIANASGGYLYGGRMVGKVAIWNMKTTDFHGKVRLQLWIQKDGDDYVSGGTILTKEIDVPANQTVDVDFEYNDLKEGHSYYLPVNYVDQEGELSGAGIWSHSWRVMPGIISWNGDGTVAGQPYQTNISIDSTACGLYADCKNINSLTPTVNPNTIYAFADGMTPPGSLAEANVVVGNHAKNISLEQGYPYYIPVRFQADEATFSFTFPLTERGDGWHVLTLPFAPDAVLANGSPVSVNDSLSHVWIYEYTSVDDDGNVCFEPAKLLRGNTPYIIASDSTMAGCTIQFSADDVTFHRTGSDKMMVSTQAYKFLGTTLTPTVCNCYVLNAEGTAFEYTTSDRQMSGLSAYFTTTYAEADRPGSILLPECTAVTGIHPYDDATALSSPMGEGSGVRQEFRGGLFDLGGKLHPHGGNRNVKSGIYIVGGKKVVVK